jgi:phosphoribosylformimino-5-aminoimidazole carboxamide ribotide isomerase
MLGIQRIVFTDIARDGMLNGPNLEALGDFARHTGLKVVASGGVSSMEDLELLKSWKRTV